VQQWRVNKRFRVLVVDDYPGARYRRMRLLLDAGEFDVAEDYLGRVAIHRISEERFDLVVIDMHLPDVSGLDVCRAVRADPRTAGLPLLAVSAVADRTDAERMALDAGASAFIADESDGEAFIDAVRSLLKQRSAT
jgi:CheY-like chemotaxis protein